uniref:Uncharacterized protein LOC104244874 n=1 Tax=Nicotiana sylvestris TaxID=4096 RepID=A0A1U7YHH3_NICSY|nr:PREDICTED: uncharacterized protein LOC104244874 [Nicotiana sylvestris]
MSAPPENWEGKSTARLPLFNGQYYSWWKTRMRDHMQEEDYELCDIITNGPLATLKKNAEGEDVPKTRADCNAEDLKKWEENSTSRNSLFVDLVQMSTSEPKAAPLPSKYETYCKWPHEGTTQVKRSRGISLFSQYENFAMRDGETIKEIYTRLSTLTNELKSLRRIIPEDERVEKY